MRFVITLVITLVITKLHFASSQLVDFQINRILL